MRTLYIITAPSRPLHSYAYVLQMCIYINISYYMRWEIILVAHIHTHTRTRTSTRTCSHTESHTHTHTHTRTTYTPSHTHTHTHIYTCTHAQTHIHTRNNTQMRTLQILTAPSRPPRSYASFSYVYR